MKLKTTNELPPRSRNTTGLRQKSKYSLEYDQIEEFMESSDDIYLILDFETELRPEKSSVFITAVRSIINHKAKSDLTSLISACAFEKRGSSVYVSIKEDE